MNYYPFHVGDYAAHTAHLDPMEDIAYRRMIDLYCLREGPLPADAAEVARLIRMRSNVAEVQAVLAEFFTLTDAGWTQSRCEREVGIYRAQVNGGKVGALKRWGKGGNGVAMPPPSPPHVDPNSNQEPRTKNQELSARIEREQAEADARALLEAQGFKPTAAGTICKAMRGAGLMSSNPGDPRLLALLAQGATEEEFVGIACEAVTSGKGFAWVLHVLAARRAEAASINLAPAVQAVDVGAVAVSKTAADLADLAAHALKAQGPEAQAARLAVMAKRKPQQAAA